MSSFPERAFPPIATGNSLLNPGSRGCRGQHRSPVFRGLGRSTVTRAHGRVSLGWFNFRPMKITMLFMQSRFSGTISSSLTSIPYFSSRYAISSRMPVESMIPFSRKESESSRSFSEEPKRKFSTMNFRMAVLIWFSMRFSKNPPHYWLEFKFRKQASFRPRPAGESGQAPATERIGIFLPKMKSCFVIVNLHAFCGGWNPGFIRFPVTRRCCLAAIFPRFPRTTSSATAWGNSFKPRKAHLRDLSHAPFQPPLLASERPPGLMHFLDHGEMEIDLRLVSNEVQENSHTIFLCDPTLEDP